MGSLSEKLLDEADAERAGKAVHPLTTTRDYAAFVRSMEAAPEDTSLRLVYADWLAENGEERLAQVYRESATDVVFLDMGGWWRARFFHADGGVWYAYKGCELSLIDMIIEFITWRRKWVELAELDVRDFLWAKQP